MFCLSFSLKDIVYTDPSDRIFLQEDAITAIDKNDTGGLKSAYSQLKDYEKRILELEEDICTDDTTGMYNRKYLFNHELDKD